MIKKTNGELSAECDDCGQEDRFGGGWRIWGEFLEIMREEGWQSFRDECGSGKWIHLCPACVGGD